MPRRQGELGLGKFLPRLSSQMISLTSFHCSYPHLLQNRLVVVGPFREFFFFACSASTVIDRSRARVTRPVMIFSFNFFLFPFPPSWSRVPSAPFRAVCNSPQGATGTGSSINVMAMSCPCLDDEALAAFNSHWAPFLCVQPSAQPISCVSFRYSFPCCRVIRPCHGP
ncbi:hypothetical protein HDV57DRAFT_338324 [Trichoderma longibrachiatum]|uniref:Uncharacterized protein n=1 Tax=Trichoderma longibrachiatum ATCC 18648 TaxID=983965 RepID=A0A2T4BYP0_TRILO|nr:hypothetical protein M440DRAFT_114202 [Trichoderma longibrachiatum ATCC 18648]